MLEPNLLNTHCGNVNKPVLRLNNTGDLFVHSTWAHIMRDRFGAKSERAWKLRFHTQTAGVSLTAQQPYNNVVRTALQALSGVLGGTQSLHTNSLDEALSIPSESAIKIALQYHRDRGKTTKHNGLESLMADLHADD